MSLEASPAQQVHIERHHRAIELLNRKLALIPKRILPMGDYPSIHQFYEQADSLHIPDIPPEYQLLFLLKHYNTIVAAGGLALKQDVRAGIIDLDVAKAVCFWRLDRRPNQRFSKECPPCPSPPTSSGTRSRTQRASLGATVEEKKEREVSKKRKAEDDTLLLAMDNVRVKDVPSYLTDELFERERVQLLMRESDEDIKPSPHPDEEKDRGWRPALF
ncbi:hypothetical protein SLS61_004861 [Didymella pomorum]